MSTHSSNDVSYAEVYRAAHILEADRAAIEILQPPVCTWSVAIA